MGVHKKPGMNTSGATVDCGFIFLWKGSRRGSSSASLSQGSFEGHRQLSSYIKQEISAEAPTHDRFWRLLKCLLLHPKWQMERQILESKRAESQTTRQSTGEESIKMSY